MTDYIWDIEVKGGPGDGSGPGSGHHGHRGRPGQQGGSLPGTGGGDISIIYPVGRGIVRGLVVEYKGGMALWKEMSPEHLPSSIQDGHMEVAADKVDNALEFNLVPHTEYATLDGVEGTAQEWIEMGRTGDDIATKSPLYEQNADRINDMAVLDYILLNIDRHSGNYVFDEDGAIWAVDHGAINMLNNSNNDFSIDLGTLNPFDFQELNEHNEGIIIRPETLKKLKDPDYRARVRDAVSAMGVLHERELNRMVDRMRNMAYTGLVPVVYYD